MKTSLYIDHIEQQPLLTIGAKEMRNKQLKYFKTIRIKLHQRARRMGVKTRLIRFGIEKA